MVTAEIQSTAGFFLPRYYFTVAGTGDSSSPLVAFDRALLSVKLGNVNLVRLSSIIAPGLIHQRPNEIQTGSFVGAAYASTSSSIPGTLIAAAVAIAHPLEKGRESIIMERAGSFSAKDAESAAIEMAVEALKSRQLHLKTVEAASAEHIVEAVGCAFAAVIQL
jgi:arginine decarboxylase